jgi:hypothetical protein
MCVAGRSQNALDQRTTTIIKRTILSDAPVVLITIDIAGDSILDNEVIAYSAMACQEKVSTVEARADLFKHLAITFKNTSDKPIVAMRVSLIINHPSSTLPQEITLAPSRPVPVILNREMKATESLGPKEEITYSVHPSTLARFEKEFGGVPARTIEVRLRLVQFDYDTGWDGYSDTLFRRDMNNPRRWNAAGPLTKRMLEEYLGK